MPSTFNIRGLERIAPGISTSGLDAVAIGPTLTEGLKWVVQEETLSPAAIETNLATNVPAGSVIVCVLANCETALTGGGTTVTWSIGTTASPDKYGTAGYPASADSLAQNGKSNWVGWEKVTSAETITLTGTVTGGAADGDTALTLGSVRIVVIYLTFVQLEDA